MEHAKKSGHAHGVIRLLVAVPLFAYGTAMLLGQMPILEFKLNFYHLMVVYGLVGVFVRILVSERRVNVKGDRNG